jgi:ATP-dependent DNA helicase RecG
MSSLLETPIEYLKGIGPQRGDLLRKELGIFTFGHLLRHFPFRYIDRTVFHFIRSIESDESFVQLKGVIRSMSVIGNKRAKRLVATFTDNTGSVELVWFQGQSWFAEKLKTGTEYIVYGKPGLYMGRWNIPHPEIEEASSTGEKPTHFQPVYSSTEKLKLRGLDSAGIRKEEKLLLSQLKPGDLNETLGDELKGQLLLTGLFSAYRQIHFPETMEELKSAELRLKFDELFYIQLRLLRIHHHRQTSTKGFIFSKVGEFFNGFYKTHLPFQLTEAQKRVVREIRTDAGSGRQMNRLMQGDVGSGKTVVALMSMLLANDNGFQACLMAPTEILAQQHFRTFKELLGTLPVQTALLTGTTPAKERKKLRQALESGEVKILIGTHAVLEDSVRFLNLGLVVIDEQHRFGVAQRARLQEKNVQPPHVLIMTATPIPRTLALTLYGDLDTSVIDELPPGRKPIKTIHYTESKRLRVYGFMKEQIAMGRQVYVVYPLIEESEKMDFQNLQQGYDNLVTEFPPPHFQVSIVHGKLSSEQKEFEMQRFVKGETQIMVATTVIEVGVNIPNASVMVIESAERFGLSQLHQLRGRVGRGADQSYCILMTGYKLGADSRLRMKTMEETNDGFRISEVDLKLRGPGDLAGTQQSGVLELKLANLAQDGKILQLARKAAGDILNEDPELIMEKNRVYSENLRASQKDKPDWVSVG